MDTVTLARQAMATRFEIVLHGSGPAALRAAGEEALDEIDRLEARLSLYRPASEISHLNARAAREPVRVSPELFALLQHAQRLHAETGGAFDITIAPLVRCWGFMAGEGKVPNASELDEARARIGLQHVHLNPADLSVSFDREGVMLDLGAIGKGYAVEKAAEILLEAGMTSALVHGGTSTVHAIGRPPDAEFWKVAVAGPKGSQEPGDPIAPEMPGAISLRDEALSVSAVWGKFFEADNKKYGHVLDPRTGQPASDAVLAAVVQPSATETDALSTALLVLGKAGHERITALRPGTRTLLITERDGVFRTETQGLKPAFEPEAR